MEVEPLKKTDIQPTPQAQSHGFLCCHKRSDVTAMCHLITGTKQGRSWAEMPTITIVTQGKSLSLVFLSFCCTKRQQT